MVKNVVLNVLFCKTQNVQFTIMNTIMKMERNKRIFTFNRITEFNYIFCLKEHVTG